MGVLKMTNMKKLEQLINKKDYSYVNNSLTTENFPIPEKIRTEGWKLIEIKNSFSSKEALDEIKKQGCTPANAYELALWSESHRQEIKKGTGVIALGQLWFSDGYRRVPCVGANSDGGFGFDLGYFGIGWGGDYCLLCFCDLELGTLDTSKKDSDTLTLSRAIEICKEAGLTVTKIY